MSGMIGANWYIAPTFDANMLVLAGVALAESALAEGAAAPLPASPAVFEAFAAGAAGLAAGAEAALLLAVVLSLPSGMAIIRIGLDGAAASYERSQM